MASRDRFPLDEPQLQLRTPTKAEPQFTLFARTALPRQLPVFKEGPEDAWITAERTIH